MYNVVCTFSLRITSHIRWVFCYCGEPWHTDWNFYLKLIIITHTKKMISMFFIFEVDGGQYLLCYLLLLYSAYEITCGSKN